MIRWDLANELCRAVRAKRLMRIGERPDHKPFPLEALPFEERQTWLDVASVVLDRAEGHAHTLRSLADDYERYGWMLVHDPDERDNMRRAVVVEMRVLVETLWSECE